MKKTIMVLLILSAMLMSACSNNGQTDKAGNDLPVLGSEERTELNKAAGEITYMTGFYYAASPPDVQVVVADELGYFEELGLNVEIIPGLDAEGMKYLAANQAQLASSGTPSQVIQSVAQGADISGIAVFGSVGTSALLVMEDSDIYEPKDLKGKMIGYHGALPANLIAMLQHNDMEVSDIEGVSVGYDPTILSSGQVDALTIYKSNEPYQLEKLGEKVRIIDPGQFGAETSFGVLAINNGWAKQHPTAAEDFLRAVLKAHDYAAEHPEQVVEILAGRSETVYDQDAELNRWKVELDLLEQSRDKSYGVGWQSAEQWEREASMLLDANVIQKMLTADKLMNNAYLEAVYEGTELIWLPDAS